MDGGLVREGAILVASGCAVIGYFYKFWKDPAWKPEATSRHNRTRRLIGQAPASPQQFERGGKLVMAVATAMGLFLGFVGVVTLVGGLRR